MNMKGNKTTGEGEGRMNFEKGSMKEIKRNMICCESSEKSVIKEMKRYYKIMHDGDYLPKGYFLISHNTELTNKRHYGYYVLCS